MMGTKAYRLICLLNKTANIMGYIIISKIERETGARQALSDSQYGFRKEKQALMVIKRTLAIAHKKWGRGHAQNTRQRFRDIIRC